MTTLVALALAGCGGDDGAGATKTVTVDEAAPTETAAEATATAEQEPADDPADAVATQTVQARGAGEGTVDIAVQSLEVRGELATLSLTFTPHLENLTSGEPVDVYAMHGDVSPFVNLLDPVNLKRYVVVVDSANDQVSSLPEEAETVNDQPVDMQFTYAAPPEDVEQIDVAVGDWPPFRDVPVTR